LLERIEPAAKLFLEIRKGIELRRSLPTYEIVSRLRTYMESIFEDLLEDINDEKLIYNIRYEVYDSLLWDLGIYRKTGCNVLGMNLDNGCGQLFDDIPECLASGYEYVRDVYPIAMNDIAIKDVGKEGVIPIDMKVPKFTLSLQHDTYIPNNAADKLCK
jgi:hypothetical protein